MHGKEVEIIVQIKIKTWIIGIEELMSTDYTDQE